MLAVYLLNPPHIKRLQVHRISPISNCMCSKMPNKVPVMTECFPTFITCVRSLSSVASLVIHKKRLATKAFIALTTLIRFLTSVCTRMLEKPCILNEGFATLFTMTALLSIVYPLMLAKVGAKAESLPTCFTFIGFSPVWILPCLKRSLWILKAFPHSLH